MSGTNFSIDDDGATDQAGNSIASFFAPRITPSGNLTTNDINGYVQFTIRFYQENGTAGEQYNIPPIVLPVDDYSTPPPFGGLSGLNYIHYDIDGSTVGTGGWFRETGVVQNIPTVTINADASTELVPYSYTYIGNWKGFAGSVCERTGVSRCSQVTAAASYITPQTQLTFRMGYDYNYNGTSFNSKPTRQYGSRFGCFTFPQQSTLPVKLLSFEGVYKNNFTYLSWTADNQVNFSAYEIERSSNGIDFSGIGVKTGQGIGSERQQYQFTDDLSLINSDAFFYRLKMIDIDGRFSYSNIIMIRKDGVKSKGLAITPNPIISGNMATVRFYADAEGPVELKVIEMSGKVVLTQHSNVNEGTNSVAITNLNRLQPGFYILQLNNHGINAVTKFSVIR